MSRVDNRARKGLVAAAFVLCAALTVVFFVGSGFASAGSGDEPGTFGIKKVSSPLVEAVEVEEDELLASVSDSASFGSQLTTAASRDISTSVSNIAAEEEAARLEAMRIDEIETAERVALAAQYSGANGLPDVDWSMGKQAFIAEWTERINNYLAGFPLEGYGYAFAEAAWENMVDPRLSPAISNTESTRGSSCFTAYNAWGWYGSLGSDWDSSIRAHVAGIGNYYGYTVSLAFAQRYCPPTYESWYANTVNEMMYM